jgi:hypothetical protein
MSYDPTNWKTGDVVTSAKLNKIEGGVSEVSEAYEPTVWQTGDVVTSAKLNKIEQALADATAESWVTVFDGSVTMAQQGGSPSYTLITLTGALSETIKVAFEGQEYECEMVQADQSYYGANVFDSPVDWSVYPFCLFYAPDGPSGQTMFITENAGTYSLKVEATEESGGSSDFSVANVTFVNNYVSGVNAGFCEIAQDYDITAIFGVAGVPTGTTECAIPLYQGTALVILGVNENLSIETSGGITYDGNNGLLIIEGDGRVTFEYDDK